MLRRVTAVVVLISYLFLLGQDRYAIPIFLRVIAYVYTPFLEFFYIINGESIDGNFPEVHVIAPYAGVGVCQGKTIVANHALQ